MPAGKKAGDTQVTLGLFASTFSLMVIAFWGQTEDKSLPPDSQSSLPFLQHSGATRIQLEGEKHFQGIENSSTRVTVLEVPLESPTDSF